MTMRICRFRIVFGRRSASKQAAEEFFDWMTSLPAATSPNIVDDKSNKMAQKQKNEIEMKESMNL